jgi:hypothetical protein
MEKGDIQKIPECRAAGEKLSESKSDVTDESL